MKNAGVQFGFARATMGTVDYDSQFAANMTGSRAAGIPIGPYHYGYPNTYMNPLSAPVKQDAINEATDFVNRIQPYYDANPGWYLRPVLDVEELPANAEVNTVAEQRAYLSAWVKDFNSVVRDRLGVDVIIYCNSNYASNYFTADLASFDLWIARWTYNPNNPPSASQLGIWSNVGYDFWQYSDSGNLGGENPLDLNHFPGTLNDLQAYVVGGEPPLEGDYNSDGVVDAADYTKWRDTWTRTNTDLSADGNNNGAIDAGDRDVWAANYGAVAGSAAGVPEPTGIAVFVSLLATAALGKHGR
jgi:GH25 family lysozyme M1 (1,4-beta-N-acetylmuramidase)